MHSVLLLFAIQIPYNHTSWNANFSNDVNPRLIFWIVNFIVNHSDSSPPRYTFVFPLYFHWLSTRRCPTSYSFYTLYKWLHWPLHTTPIIKYSNDSAAEDPSKSDSVYYLNVKKTKEMLIAFRKAPAVISDLFIDGVKVERVTEYKYLGTVLDKLDFNKNTDFIHKRCQPKIFCLQR